MAQRHVVAGRKTQSRPSNLELYRRLGDVRCACGAFAELSLRVKDEPHRYVNKCLACAGFAV